MILKILKSSFLMHIISYQSNMRNQIKQEYFVGISGQNITEKPNTGPGTVR